MSFATRHKDLIQEFLAQFEVVQAKEREAFMVTDPEDEENVQFFLDRKEAEYFAEGLAGEHGDASGMVRKFIEVLE